MQVCFLFSSYSFTVFISGESDAPKKRSRGRPKGSKNKKIAESTAGSSTSTVPKKRGRPPKVAPISSSSTQFKRVPPLLQEKTEDDDAPKRKRGRPPKPKPEGAGDTPKRKRGRPPKTQPGST